MTLHLTRDEADRLDADGRVVLFRAGEFSRSVPADPFADTIVIDRPPAEFVEAAQPCGNKYHAFYLHDVGDNGCPDCLGGKRRIAVAVPCKKCAIYDGHRVIRGGDADCDDGLVTVGHVVVEWGPWPVVDRPSRSPDKPCVTILPRGMAMLWPRDGRPESEPPGDIILSAYPPDVDRQSLVGQYALGIRKVGP